MTNTAGNGCGLSYVQVCVCVCVCVCVSVCVACKSAQSCVFSIQTAITYRCTQAMQSTACQKENNHKTKKRPPGGHSTIHAVVAASAFTMASHVALRFSPLRSEKEAFVFGDNTNIIPSFSHTGNICVAKYSESCIGSLLYSWVKSDQMRRISLLPVFFFFFFFFFYPLFVSVSVMRTVMCQSQMLREDKLREQMPGNTARTTKEDPPFFRKRNESNQRSRVYFGITV